MSGMAEVLAAHTGPTTLGSIYRCQCGHEYEPVRREHGQTDRMKPLHAGHVTEVLTAAGFGPVKEAGAVALEEAVDDPTLRLSGHSGISITRLRARAAAVRGDS